MNYRFDACGEIILIGDIIKLVQTSSEYIVKNFYDTPLVQDGLFLVPISNNIQHSKSGFVIGATSARRISPLTSEHIVIKNEISNLTPTVSNLKSQDKIADDLINTLTNKKDFEKEMVSENLLNQQSNIVSDSKETKKEMLNDFITLIDDLESLNEMSEEIIFAGRITSWDGSYIFESFSRNQTKVVKNICLFIVRNINSFRIDEEYHEDILLEFYKNYYNENYDKIISSIRELDPSKEVIVEEINLL